MPHLLADTILGFHVDHASLPNSPAEWLWLILGVSGSGIFGIRFFIQWMHSERHKESRIPVSFWWLSVAGTIMAASYFIHKHQWVALLGNGPQLIPYARNLVLIYRKKAAVPADPIVPDIEPARS
jgi:lipid-A-disaccharide synthase-like uncharacterized protein